MNTLRISESAGVLPEGPIWNHRTDALLWVDIDAGTLVRWTAGLHIETVWTDPDCISGVWLACGSNLVVAAGAGAKIFSNDGQLVAAVAGAPALDATLRFNDDAFEARGRLLVGTMARNAEYFSSTLGGPFRIDGGGDYKILVDGLTMSNGWGWSPDGNSMYLEDSMRHRILVISYESTDWPVRADACSAITIPEDLAVPDGLRVRSDGTLKVAAILGSKILEIDPQVEIDRSLALPLRCPTSCCLGGKEMDTLFITTSTRLLKPEHDDHSAGHVLALSGQGRGLHGMVLKIGLEL
jgi:sugar lactone lactonase YvrE